MELESLVYNLIVTWVSQRLHLIESLVLVLWADINFWRCFERSLLDVPGRETLGGCEKHKLNSTKKQLKDKLIEMHTLLVQQAFFQMTIKMSENCRF